jgi:hypothetical protein
MAIITSVAPCGRRMAREAVMIQPTPQRAATRPRRPWAGLLEERFTNIDIVMLMAAILMTGFIGLVSGVALVH